MAPTKVVGTWVEVPIGTILPWAKNIKEGLSLPEGWVECNGQTVDDPSSPLYGVTLPNLNGENRFLRGNSTSGGTGGNETHTHSVSLPRNPADENDADYNGARSWYFAHNTTVTSGSASNIPPYYNVVWIIRIK
ncbi:MAG: hypothetical protein DRN92_03125 [Thermoproteota archaeon]|nr:MAG: hypothetical protein DRN92_03125 [Candidatus Korarchaeota archaeon]